MNDWSNRIHWVKGWLGELDILNERMIDRIGYIEWMKDISNRIYWMNEWLME